MSTKSLVSLLVVFMIGMTGSAHAISYDLNAISTSPSFTNFSIRYEDTGDTLLHYNEITSFSGMTYFGSGGFTRSFNTVSRVASISGLAVDSGSIGGVAGWWMFTQSGINPLFGNPGFWTYSREVVGSPPGTTPGNPILPTSTAGSFSFSFTPVDYTRPTYIDPDIAIGYAYEVVSGPNFASVIVPDALPNGDATFTLEVEGSGPYSLLAGTSFNFLDINPLGFSSFSILDIAVDELLDPGDPLAFMTGLTFTGPGAVEMTQTPITAERITPIPEPSTVILLAIGLMCLGFFGVRARKG